MLFRSPYISASIVIQLLGIAVPYFQKLQREGESGRRKMNQMCIRDRYIIAPNGLQVGATLMSGETAAPEIGNALPLQNLSLIHIYRSSDDAQSTN